jgi:hypothetical protein
MNLNYTQLLAIAAQWAAILTALVAVLAYGRYLNERRKKRRKLEAHLKAARDRGVDHGQRTVLHLMSRLSMSESDVLDAAFRSKHIRPAVSVDDQTGHAKALLFEYVP